MKHRTATTIALSVLFFASGLLSVPAQSAPTSPTGNVKGYNRCINGCWRSDKYCRKHQRKIMDCNKQLGKCFDWCEDTYGEPGVPVFKRKSAPQRRLNTVPGKPSTKPNRRKPATTNTTIKK